MVWPRVNLDCAGMEREGGVTKRATNYSEGDRESQFWSWVYPLPQFSRTCFVFGSAEVW